MRTDLAGESPPGRIAASTSSTGASRTARQSREAGRAAQVGDVAVAVVGRLREDGQDQLGDRVAVRRQRRHAIRGGEAPADAPDGGHGADGIVARPMPTAEFGDQLVYWRAEGDAPILYLHGVPNSSQMWAPFLEVTGGIAVDLPGFGESGKRGDLRLQLRGPRRASSASSPTTSGSSACGCACTTGARSACCGRCASPSGWSASC